MNIRSILKFDLPYYKINREERNLAAIFYHVLLQKDNLQKFLYKINIEFPIIGDEMSIYFEYAFLRDLWFSIDKNDNDTKRRIILSLLKPTNISYLAVCSIEEFNTYFGAVPSPSNKYIQSPGNWSIDKYKINIPDNHEFLKVCKFKWCFNAKPDIVIHTSNNYAICIEGKFESGEGVYPSKESEKKEFGKRGINFIKQTEIQNLIMELLEIESSFVFLVQKKLSSSTHKTLLWEDAFKDLDISDSPLFIKNWIRSLTKTNINSIEAPKKLVINGNINFKNHIAPEYFNRVEKLKKSFPTAYNFLKYPERTQTAIYLKTSVNAHLYIKNYYLSYIIIGDNELTFRAKFNNMIAGETTDESKLLFSGAFQKLIDSFGGKKTGWAVDLGDKIIIKKLAPDIFFKSLISLIENF